MSGTYGTLVQVAGEYAKKQDHQVNYLLEDTDVLDSMKFEPASHTLWNVYEEITEVSGGGFVDMDSPLGAVDVKSQIKKFDLGILGGTRFVGQDKVLAITGNGGPSGAASFFAKNERVIIKNFGVTAEIDIIYNNFRAFALDSGQKLNAGGTGNANYCLLAVRYEPGECGGLYSPDAMGPREMFQTDPLSDGKLYVDPTTKVSGYGMQYKGYYGVQLANYKCVAGIFNITETNKPTGMQVDDLLNLVRAKKNTYLYCHPKVNNILADVGKGSAYRMTTDQKGVDRRISEWNGVPIVTSFNFYNASETLVTF